MLAAAQVMRQQGGGQEKIFGLAVDGSTDEGSDDSAGPVAPRGSKGIAESTKLMKSMQEEAPAFNRDMRRRMLEALGECDNHEKLAQNYAAQLPLKGQKYLGYMLWGMAAVNRELAAGRTAQWELLTLRLIAGIETFLLESHWRSAWPMTGIPEPPWLSTYVSEPRMVEHVDLSFKGRGVFPEAAAHEGAGRPWRG